MRRMLHAPPPSPPPSPAQRLAEHTRLSQSSDPPPPVLTPLQAVHPCAADQCSLGAREQHMTPPDQQRRVTRSAAAAAAAAAQATALPHEVLARVFSLLPWNDQHMTVALVSKTWHDWALQQRDGAPSFSPKPSQLLPQHAAQHAWNSRGRLTSNQQRRALLAHAAGAGDLELLRWLQQQRRCCRAPA